MDKISYSKFNEPVEHLLEVIKKVLIETNAHDMQVSNLLNWNWQYKDLPLGESHIYVAKHNNDIIGYYHIPTYKAIIDNKKVIIGQIQTVAILSEYRGKGVFQKLAEFANKDIDNFVDIIYTFPNHKSIHTFIKYNNYSLVSTLPVYILPCRIEKLIPNKLNFLKLLKPIWYLTDKLFRWSSKSINSNDNIKLCSEINKPIESLFLNFTYQNQLIRDKTFLDWRYLKSPKGKHLIFGIETNEELMACVIVKEDIIFSSKGFIVMDFAYNNIDAFKKLISNLSQIKSTDNDDFKPAFIFISGVNKGLSNLTSCGFLKIPERFVPRKLNLLVRNINCNTNTDITNPDNWLITIGDWDVF